MSILSILLELSPLCAIVYFYLFWTQRKTARLPNVLCRKSLFNSLVVQYCNELLSRPYVPTIWAFLPSIQSAYFSIRPKLSSEEKTDYLEVSFGRLVGISWPKTQVDSNSNLKKESPIVIFVGNPLLNDNSLQPFIEVAVKSGFRPSLFHHRNSSALPRFRHSSENNPSISRSEEVDDWHDLVEVILYLANKFPNSSLYVVSSSLGSPTLLKFLTSDVRSKYLKAVATVSPIWHKLKNPYLLPRPLEPFPRPKSNRVKHSLSFDSFFHKIKKHRYLSRWQDPSPSRSTVMPQEIFGRLKRLAVPALMVFSKDDPLLSQDDKSRIRNAWKNSDMLLVVETCVGGHLGFLEGGSPESWAAKLVFQYFEAAEKFKDATIG